MDNKMPTPGQWAMIGGGGVALIASFLDFGGNLSMWGEFFFPIATLIPLFCIAVGVLVALTVFANTTLPDRVLTFTWSQIYLVLGAMATLMSLCWFIGMEFDRGLGLFLSLLASIAVLVGAVMEMQRANAPGSAT